MALCLAALAVLSACGPLEPQQVARVGAERPDIVFILADDLDAAETAFMPKLNGLLVAQGTTFSSYFVTDSLCCPSRSSILRGQYPHNTQVAGNVPPAGGVAKFHSTGDDRSTIGTWLHDSGYRTALMGKYLNGYLTPQAPFPDTFVPPGWDEWDVAGNGGYGNFTYRLVENGALVAYGRRPEDYLTDVLARKGSAFLNAAALSGQPAFLYVAPFTPHQPAVTAPRHAGLFAEQTAPRPPSFDQADVSTGPAWLRARPHLTPGQIAEIDELYRRRLRTLQSIDDLIQTLVDTAARNGRLDRTYFVFSSDNGFHLGQHRLPPGKQTAFDEDIHVPLVIRGPGVSAGATRSAFIENVDLAPTFAALANVAPADFVDGRSFVPLLRGETPPAWRTAALIEHLGGGGAGDPDDDDAFLQAKPDPALPVAGGSPPGPPGGVPGAVTTYEAVRTAEWLFVEYITGEHELYDRRADPYELRNVYPGADPGLVAALRAQLGALRACAAARCRAADTVAGH